MDDDQALFPLPLTSFEQFMLEEDHPDYPMTFMLRFCLEGRVEVEPLIEALREALERHPLLSSTIGLHKGTQCWFYRTDLIPPIQLDRNVWLREEPWRRPLDLTKETGLRVWGETTASETHVTLLFHHACCDGIGASQFLEDIAVAYARRVLPEPERPEARTLNPERLRGRLLAEGRRVAELTGSLLYRIRVIAWHIVRYWGQRTEPLIAGRSPVPSRKEDSRPEQSGIVSGVIDKATFRKLREFAKDSGTMLNDILVRDLMRTLAHYNDTSGGRLWRGRICVLVPTSLRGPGDDELPASNVVSYVFLSQSRHQMQDSLKMLHGLNEEMTFVHQVQGGWLFVEVLNVLARIPQWLRWPVRRSRVTCMSTAVLSHLGNLLNSIGGRLGTVDGHVRVGNVVMKSVECVPPLRRFTNAAFATFVFGGQLMVSGRMDPHTFSPEESQSLLERFLEQLRQTAKEKK